MTEERVQNNNTRRVASAICRIFGIVLLVGVILTAIPVTVPHLMHYVVYNVVSGSMEPEIPVGSIVYVKPAEASEIEAGEIIAFWDGDDVVTHRVTENHTDERTISTKGDANELADLDDVSYADVIGRVTRHIPHLGRLMALYASRMGKVFLIVLALIGVILNVLAGHLKNPAAGRG